MLHLHQHRYQVVQPRQPLQSLPPLHRDIITIGSHTPSLYVRIPEAMSESNNAPLSTDVLEYVQYHGDKEETCLPAIRQLISKDLSEPYSIYVYRYFLYQWGDLCYMALDSSSTLIGVVVCKLEPHRSGTFRGYIAMLAVQEAHRGKGIATKLVCMAIDAMKEREADEIVLETEVTNTASLKLYERLGFLRSKRLHRYYLNGNTAFRLVLYLKPGTASKSPHDGMGRGYENAGYEQMSRIDGVMTDTKLSP